MKQKIKVKVDMELLVYSGEEQVSEASIALYLMVLLVCVVLRHTRAGFPWINESVLTLLIVSTPLLNYVSLILLLLLLFRSGLNK